MRVWKDALHTFYERFAKTITANRNLHSTNRYHSSTNGAQQNLCSSASQFEVQESTSCGPEGAALLQGWTAMPCIRRKKRTCCNSQTLTPLFNNFMGGEDVPDVSVNSISTAAFSSVEVLLSGV